MILLNRRKYFHKRRPQGAPADLADAVVTLASDKVYYTGNPVYPSVSVTYEGAALIVNTDYTLNYTDNTNIGAATVTVTGMGEYTGSVVKTFQIVMANDAWLFDISKTSSTPDDTYEISGLGSNSGSRLVVLDGGIIATPGPATSFNFFNLATSESATTGNLGRVSAGGVSLDGTNFIFVVTGILSHAVASTPGDVASLAFSVRQSNVTTSSCRSLVISGDGLHVFMIGLFDYGLQGKIYRHDLSTAWDFSTMSAAHSETINFVGPATSNKYQDFCFSPDGKKMLWFDNATAYVYDLSTAWDPSSANSSTYKAKTFPDSIAAPVVAVDAAGEHLYIGGGGSLKVYSLTA